MERSITFHQKQYSRELSQSSGNAHHPQGRALGAGGYSFENSIRVLTKPQSEAQIKDVTGATAGVREGYTEGSINANQRQGKGY